MKSFGFWVILLLLENNFTTMLGGVVQIAQKKIVRLLRIANKVRLPIGALLFFMIITVISIPVIAMTIIAVVVSTNTVIRNSHYEATANMVLIEQAIEEDFSELFITLDDITDRITTDNGVNFEGLEPLLRDIDIIDDIVVFDKQTQRMYSTDNYYLTQNTFFTHSFFNNDVQSIFDRNTQTVSQERMGIGFFDAKKQVLLSSIHFIESDTYRQEYGFSFIKSMGDLGYICAVVNPTILIEDYTAFFDFKNTNFMLVAGSDHVYASSLSDRISNTLHEVSGYLGTYIADNSSEIYTMLDERVIVTTHSINSLGFSLIMSTPYQYIQNFLRDTTETITIIFIITLVIAFLASFLIARRISVPIVSLKNSMKQFAMGNMHTRSVIIGNNEITDLSNSFNDMTTEISSLIDSLDTQKAIAENYRLRLTNEQTNPHFLYNVLEMISSLININMYDQAAEATRRLANFYRGSLSDGNDIITIEREQSFLIDYLTLQKMRYVEQLEIEISVSETLFDCVIPKLTLQPLAENAIYHGIRKKRGKGLLTLDVFEKDNRIIIMVKDNGVGMSVARKKELLSLNRLSPITEHFGLSSILHRLNYHFDGDIKFNIDSKEGEYTTISLNIPKIKFSEGKM